MLTRRNAILSAAALFGGAWLYRHLRPQPEHRLGRQPGFWVWYTQPSAVRIRSGILASSVARSTDGGGETILTRHEGGAVGEPVILGKSKHLDDHDQAALLVRVKDGQVLAFFCHHSDNRFFVAASLVDDPKSAADWSKPVDIALQLGGSEYTYAQPVEMGDGTIYLFLRARTVDSLSLHYTKSTDGGTTWKLAKRVLTGQRPYFCVARNGPTRIDIACNDGHPNAEQPPNSLYHFYMEMDGAGGEAFRASDGRNLGDLPLTPGNDLIRVWDGSTPAGESSIWQVGIDAKGHPALLYAVFPERDADHRYRRALWTGDRWDDSEICPAGPTFADASAGEFYFTGGCCFDLDDIDIVYASRKAGERRQIFRMETRDGAGWKERQLTWSALDCARPYLPIGTRTLLYGEISAYRHYVDYEAQIVALPVE
ncbi:BNR-4 repeat-containing protein [Mesorhizobium sp. KR9-304]|uniref:BNR-4 repeat-containing protein n=1 Tax=Mesorhizobium sp. KR9-304 TaxID=3156614 RepID=UPI0032B4EF78